MWRGQVAALNLACSRDHDERLSGKPLVMMMEASDLWERDDLSGLGWAYRVALRTEFSAGTAMPSLIQDIASAGAITPGHGVSKPLASKACLTLAEVRNAISACAATTCLLPELIPATYTE